MKVKIKTALLEKEYEAPDGQTATQLFFDDIRSGKIAIGDLAVIGTWDDGAADVVPFRIGPALIHCGLLTHEQVVDSMYNTGYKFTVDEVKEMVQQDAWMVREDPEVNEIEGVQ